MPEQARTVGEILDLGESYLKEQRIETPRLMVEVLLSRLLKRPRLELALDYAKPLSDAYLESMRRGLKRVASGEPIQYIIGETGFMRHRFKTDARALIPRPETEILVQTVLDCDMLWQRQRPAIVDVGTGSGCIILSLAAVKPQARYLALDISEDALALARENAEQLGLSDHVLFAKAELSDVVEPESLDAIVSNPPYIKTEELEGLPLNVRDYEPRIALDGGPNGTTVIETLIEEASMALKPGGMLFLEIGEKQGTTVCRLLQDAGFSKVQIQKDLNDRDRIVIGQWDGGTDF